MSSPIVTEDLPSVKPPQDRPPLDPETQATWDALVQERPVLASIMEQVHAIKDPGGKSYCANRSWYELYTGPRWLLKEAFAGNTLGGKCPIAYDILYSRLPDCRNCACF